MPCSLHDLLPMQLHALLPVQLLPIQLHALLHVFTLLTVQQHTLIPVQLLVVQVAVQGLGKVLQITLLAKSILVNLNIIYYLLPIHNKSFFP